MFRVVIKKRRGTSSAPPSQAATGSQWMVTRREWTSERGREMKTKDSAASTMGREKEAARMERRATSRNGEAIDRGDRRSVWTRSSGVERINECARQCTRKGDWRWLVFSHRLKRRGASLQYGKMFIFVTTPSVCFCANGKVRGA
ncbi:unnamed protein product [Scytosiphon promiscuus]